MNEKLKQNIRKEKLFNLYELKNFSNLNYEEYSLAYAQSAIYVESLEQIYGIQIFDIIIELLKDNLKFDDAIAKTVSPNYEILIKKHILKKYSWLKLIDFTDILFSVMPLLLVIGFIIKS